MTRPLELQIRPYWDVLVTSAGNVLKTSKGDVPWRYIEDNMGTSIGRLLVTPSGRRRDVILPSGLIKKIRLISNFMTSQPG